MVDRCCGDVLALIPSCRLSDFLALMAAETSAGFSRQTLIVGDFNPVSSIQMGVGFHSLENIRVLQHMFQLVASEGIVSRLGSGFWLC